MTIKNKDYDYKRCGILTAFFTHLSYLVFLSDFQNFVGDRVLISVILRVFIVKWWKTKSFMFDFMCCFKTDLKSILFPLFCHLVLEKKNSYKIRLFFKTRIKSSIKGGWTEVWLININTVSRLKRFYRSRNII